MTLRLPRSVLIALAIACLPASPVLAADLATSDAEDAVVSVAVEDPADSELSAEDQEFLSHHQEDGAELAGGEVNMTEGEVVLIVLGSVIVVLLIVIAA